MKRIYLKIAYDGTNYKGWQKQPNAITIEGILNNKLSKILGEKIEIIGASRTDSGVHALCNVAVLILKLQFLQAGYPVLLIEDYQETLLFRNRRKFPLFSSKRL